MERNKFEEERLDFVNRIENFLQQKALPEAERLAEERLTLFPDDPDALCFTNLILIERGRIEDSRAVFRRLENNVLRISSIYLRAADTYRAKGLDRDAVFCYRKFISLNPLAGCAEEVAARIFLMEKEIPSVSEFEESDDRDLPKPEFYTITLADIYIKQGHWKMAGDILTEIIAREPSNVQARAKLDAVLSATGRESSAGPAPPSTNYLIETLSLWLDNIGRLKHAKR
jgi:tetratricopeptide (TPR) repeat protein